MLIHYLQVTKITFDEATKFYCVKVAGHTYVPHRETTM